MKSFGEKCIEVVVTGLLKQCYYQRPTPFCAPHTTGAAHATKDDIGVPNYIMIILNAFPYLLHL